jgi:hypothetical protein
MSLFTMIDGASEHARLLQRIFIEKTKKDEYTDTQNTLITALQVLVI